MKQRFLGRSGLRVSELCLGTMTFGQDTDEADAHRVLPYPYDVLHRFRDREPQD